jgi:hypothetical protein
MLYPLSYGRTLEMIVRRPTYSRKGMTRKSNLLCLPISSFELNQARSNRAKPGSTGQWSHGLVAKWVRQGRAKGATS